MKPTKNIIANQEEMSAIRRLLHQNPQTAYEETFASDLIAKKLTEWGIPHKRGIAVTGIVATIEGKNTGSGKTIALRADIDALDITEQTNLPHASKNSGKMHACGHDGHTAILLATAKHLKENNNFNGTVHLIFQPAEEADGGAHRMLKDGLFEDFPCDYIFGLHNWPQTPIGKIETKVGALLASVDEFEITVVGTGGHAAMREFTNDPLIIATEISQEILKLNTTDAVASICNFNVGTGATNVIADTAHMNGTVRTFSPETRESIKKQIYEIAAKVSEKHKSKATIDYSEKIDPTINTEDGVAMAVKAAEAIVRKENVNPDCKPTMGGEDFGAFLQHKPGAFVFIGQGTEDKKSPHNQTLHSPYYDFNDEIIPIGASYFIQIVKNYLQ